MNLRQGAVTTVRSPIPSVESDVRVCQMADGQQVHEKISDNSAEQRSFRFEHLRVPLPVRRSGGTFTVTAGPEPDTATVILRSTFEPLDSTGADELTSLIQGAFGQSLEALRRFVEDKLPWDVR